MVWMPARCLICGSDKHSRNSVCGNCHDRDAEADAIHCAKEAYAGGHIDAVELESRIWKALTNPPKPSWAGIMLVLR